jgi:hypothetical protein
MIPIAENESQPTKRLHCVFLPAAIGCLSAALMLWDIHNQRIIESMGMAWDTGAPLWPYQTPDTLLMAINAPAFVLAKIFSVLTRFDMIHPRNYFLVFPSILLWWGLVGWYVDRRAQTKVVRKQQSLQLLLFILATLLLLAGFGSLWDALRWWWNYSRTFWSVTDLILLRLVAPSIWSFVLSLIAFSAAKERLHPPSDR